MERRVRIFHSHEEAERADREEMLALKPEARMLMLYELIEQGAGDALQRFERVCRITKLGQSEE